LRFIVLLFGYEKTILSLALVVGAFLTIFPGEATLIVPLYVGSPS
jgi:hypothetical protein